MIPNPKKIHAVQEWPIPTDVTEARQFLGLASYHCRCFLDIAAPLNALTQKGVRFDWNEDCNKPLQRINNNLYKHLYWPTLVLTPELVSLCWKRMLCRWPWSSAGAR